jgi:hypothetical protein
VIICIEKKRRIKMPEIGEIKTGTELGTTQRGRYIYLACSFCGKPRWVTMVRSKKPHFKNICMENGCQQRHRATQQHSRDPLYWDGKSELVLGNRISAIDLRRMGYDYRDDYRSILIWHECPTCKVRYWRENRHYSAYCEGCSIINNGKSNVGEKSGRWNGGRHVERHSGYVMVRLLPSDPYYCMVKKGTRIPEHRLVYARFLGRPLESWEIIHHKGTLYPQGSYEDKSDNRIENLEYCVNQANHNVYSRMNGEIRKLQQQVNFLRNQNTMLIRQLESYDSRFDNV